jgi:hypothetical protein
MTARVLGASSTSGFSTRRVTRTTSSPSGLAGGLDGDRAVRRNGLGADVEQRDDRAAVPTLHREHVLEQGIAGVDEVVAEQHRERLVADERLRLQHRVAEAEGLALPDELHAGGVRDGVHLGQETGVPLLLKSALELQVPVEVVLDRSLAAPGDQQDVAESRAGGLVDDVLQGRAVHDRQQLLGHGLRRRQQPRAEPVHRHDRLARGPRRGGSCGGHAPSVASLVR